MSDDRGPQERGILTGADREYLQNPEEYSRQASYNRQQKITERVQFALNDFPLLATRLDDGVLEDVLAAELTTEELDDGTTEHTSEIPTERIKLPYVLAFALRASTVDDSIPPAPDVGIEESVRPFVRTIERGVEIWLGDRYDLTGDVDVSISAEDLQRNDEFVEDLADRTDPLVGRERLEAVSQLSRAGYSTDEIVDLVGVPETEE